MKTRIKFLQLFISLQNLYIFTGKNNYVSDYNSPGLKDQLTYLFQNLIKVIQISVSINTLFILSYATVNLRFTPLMISSATEAGTSS